MGQSINRAAASSCYTLTGLSGLSVCVHFSACFCVCAHCAGAHVQYQISEGLQRFHSRWRFNVSIWFQHSRLNCTFTQANSTSTRILRTLLCAHIYVCKLSFPLTLLFPSLFHRRLKVISPGKQTGNLQESVVCNRGCQRATPWEHMAEAQS